VRLNQIASLVNLESVGEVRELGVLRLGAGEVRKVLGMRIEFSGEEIKRLKL
jgi:hypothetical protein